MVNHWRSVNTRVGIPNQHANRPKYVTDRKYGSVDGKRELDLSDDAAYVNWGSGWRMPTKAQQDELRVKCRWTWTTMDGHNGYRVVGPNGNFIFLPAAENYFYGCLLIADSNGYYWSASLNTGYSIDAYYLGFYSGGYGWRCYGRFIGCSVRAVLRQ